MFHIDSTELFVYVQLLQDTSHHFSSRVSPTGMVHAIKNASFFFNRIYIENNISGTIEKSITCLWEFQIIPNPPT